MGISFVSRGNEGRLLSFFTRLRVFRFFREHGRTIIIIIHREAYTIKNFNFKSAIVLRSIRNKKFLNDLLTTVTTNLRIFNKTVTQDSQIERQKLIFVIKKSLEALKRETEKFQFFVMCVLLKSRISRSALHIQASFCAREITFDRAFPRGIQIASEIRDSTLVRRNYKLSHLEEQPFA